VDGARAAQAGGQRTSEGAAKSEGATKTDWPDQPAPPWKWRVPTRPCSRTPSSWWARIFRHHAPARDDSAHALFPRAQEAQAWLPRVRALRCARRAAVLGDHALLNGTFPTDYWLPGEYIRDSYDVEVPLMTTPAGRYTVLMGFWPGRRRQAAEDHGGSERRRDRTQVGFIEIK
jgi:hypothetical protein